MRSPFASDSNHKQLTSNQESLKYKNFLWITYDFKINYSGNSWDSDELYFKRIQLKKELYFFLFFKLDGDNVTFDIYWITFKTYWFTQSYLWLSEGLEVNWF